MIGTEADASPSHELDKAASRKDYFALSISCSGAGERREISAKKAK
jgi:hypothetical protein